MSSQPTDHQRAALMRALSSAEHVISTTPVLPSWIRIQDDHRGHGQLDVYFHQAPGEVSAFAHAYGVKCTSKHYAADTGAQLYTEATGLINGTPFCAWSLSDAAPEEGKLAEQRQAVFALDADSQPVPASLPVPTSMQPPESEAPEKDERAVETKERAVETKVGADTLVTRYRARDGQEFVHTGEFTPYGVPLYQEAGVDLPREQQATAAKIGRHLGRLTPVETAPAVSE